MLKKEWRYQDISGNTFFFHPNLSALRIKQLQRGEKDSLIEMADIKEGDRILDCTLGVGADAIVSSFAVGKTGKVVALESQPVIAALVGQGLKTYTTGEEGVDDVMRGVEVVNEDYECYLKRAADKSFDVILFDPMFRNTVYKSSAMQDVKLLANSSPISIKAIEEAKRVARRVIVLKERANSTEFTRLGFKIKKKTSSYALGVMNI